MKTLKCLITYENRSGNTKSIYCGDDFYYVIPDSDKFSYYGVRLTSFDSVLHFLNSEQIDQVFSYSRKLSSYLNSLKKFKEEKFMTKTKKTKNTKSTKKGGCK